MDLNLFEYTDYRKYLKDYYTQQKQNSHSYSYRVFANRAKLGSPNYLKLVIDGDRRITDTNLPHFIRGLGLNRSQAEYFRFLVLYTESKDVEAKNNYLRDILRIRNKNLNSVHEIQLARQEILRHWFHWVIREMVLLKDFSPDPNWIANRLKNRITAKQAKQSLELLEQLEFISFKNGRYVQSEPLISTTDGISAMLIRELHRQFIELGVHSIFNDPIGTRSINGLTLALPKSKIPEFNEALRNFRRELNKLFSVETGNEEVYHLVMNFFPLTDRPATEGGTPGGSSEMRESPK